MHDKIIFSLITFCLSIFAANGSQAQTSWVKHPTPVLTRSATFPDWKGIAAADACVMIDNDTLKMWYSGGGWLTEFDDCPHVRIGYAWSLDGIIWNDYPGNPVLDVGSDPNDFDYDGIETPTVIKDIYAPPSQRYKLWYAGRNSRCSPIMDHRFGYAYSSDGVHWTKYYGNPIMSPGDTSYWYNTFISSPSVMLDDGIYKMWFTAPDLILNGQPTDGKGNIGYATSSDGIFWIVNPNPVLIAGDQANWDSASIAEPSVVKIGSTYHMFYSALDQWTVENFQVGYASSTDGINWIKSNLNPVLKIGANTDWDAFWASHPGVIFDSTNNKFKMWYTGRNTETIISLTGYYWDIGYAESNWDSGSPGDTMGSNQLIIYPNPANSHIEIIVPIEEADYKLKVYNIQGQEVSSNNTYYPDKIFINTKIFSAGIYLVSLTQKQVQYTGKFIIQR